MTGIKVQQRPAQSQTCPWCRLGFEEAEEPWRCPQDGTLQHIACAEQFGACATCRAPYDDKNAEIMRFINSTRRVEETHENDSAPSNGSPNEKVVLGVFLALVFSPVFLTFVALFPPNEAAGRFAWVLNFWSNGHFVPWFIIAGIGAYLISLMAEEKPR